jgi:hypothetical protein
VIKRTEAKKRKRKVYNICVVVQQKEKESFLIFLFLESGRSGCIGALGFEYFSPCIHFL